MVVGAPCGHEGEMDRLLESMMREIGDCDANEVSQLKAHYAQHGLLLDPNPQVRILRGDIPVVTYATSLRRTPGEVVLEIIDGILKERAEGRSDYGLCYTKEL